MGENAEKQRKEDQRLQEIEDSLKQREKEAAKIQREFEEAERKEILALKRLDEQRVRDLKEIEKIENNRKVEELKKQQEVLEAVALLDKFLDPDSESGSILKPPNHILEAISDLSKFLENERTLRGVTNDTFNNIMDDIVVRAEQKVAHFK